MTVTFWGVGPANPPVHRAWNAAIGEAVERRWPNIRVDHNPPAGNRFEKIVAALAGGEAPDVSLLDATNMAALAQQGALAPIGGYLRRHKVDLSDFIPYHVEAGRWKDEHYGLAGHGGFFLPAYNQTLGAARGLPDPAEEQGKGTWTWSRFAEWCSRIVARQGDDAQSHGTNRGEWEMWVVNNGGNVLARDRTAFTLDRPEAVEAIQFWVDLVNRHRVAPSNEEIGQLNERMRWRAGRLGFWFEVRGNHGQEGRLIRDGFRWNSFPMPRGRANKRYLTSNGQVFMFKAAKHPEEAFRTVWGLAGREGQIARLNSGDLITPTLRSVVETPAFLNQVIKTDGESDAPVPPGFNQYWAAQLRTGELEGVPVHPRLPEIVSEISKGLAPAMAGTVGVPEAVTSMRPAVAALLRET